MYVYIIATTDGEDLVFRWFTTTECGRTIRLAGKACSIGGNPYLVYAKHVQPTVKRDYSYIVAEVSSGKEQFLAGVR